jgi:transcriptional regulator with XRE-family HTH domain
MARFPASGEAIRIRLREAMDGRSIHAVARLAGVPRETLSRALSGLHKRGPTTETLAKIAAAVGVSPGWLAFGEVAARAPSCLTHEDPDDEDPDDDV